MQKILSIIILITLMGCASTSNKQLAGHKEDLTSHSRFGVCSGYGCKKYQKTGLTNQEYQKVKNIFIPAPLTPHEERERISLAVAQIEQFIGPKTGTESDKARAVVLNFNTKGQMDCIDETFNTTTYLYLLRQDGIIKLHRLGLHLRRNLSELSYPHSTATVHEIGMEKVINGEGHYVVDSWFHQNGAPAEVIPANEWSGPWYPEHKKERYNFSAS